MESTRTTAMLNQKFNVEPSAPMEIITTDGEVILPETKHIEENIDYDYDKTRNNLHSLLAQGQSALMHAIEVAKASENPRAFEVVGGLMKQLADINHQLLDLSEKRQKMSAPKKNDPAGNQITNNNAFFVGSTTELNKMLNNMTGGN